MIRLEPQDVADGVCLVQEEAGTATSVPEQPKAITVAPSVIVRGVEGTVLALLRVGASKPGSACQVECVHPPPLCIHGTPPPRFCMKCNAYILDDM
jgi:hypothetical protein